MSEAALARYRRETERHIQRVCRFQRSMSAPEWSEKVRRMEGGRRFRFEFAPYQREMMETPYQKDVEITAFMLPSRVGKTEVMNNIFGRTICEDPCNILFMWPTEKGAEKYSKDTWTRETVEPTPELHQIFGNGTGRRLSGNTLLHKTFPGGSFTLFGANVPGDARRAKGRVLAADEIDAIIMSADMEGDPLDILWKRGFEYSDAIKIAASYPSVKGKSNIENLMLQSDWRVMYYPCAKCGEPYVFDSDQVKFDRDKPKEAWLECPINGCKLNEEDRVRMIMSNDKWTPTRPFTGIAGFHASGLISPHPLERGVVSLMHYVAKQKLAIERAQNREAKKRVFTNTFDAKTYQPPEEQKPDPEGMAQEAYEYLERITENQLKVPAGVLVVTGGGDVQGDRIEFEFVGHGLNGQTWGLGYHVLPGNTLEPEVWQKLDHLLQSEFLHPCGKVLRAAFTFIDSKYRQAQVLAFTKPRQARRVFAVFGSTTLGKPILSEPKRQKRGTLYEIGTHEAKSAIYQNAALRRDRRGSEFPANYMHYPLGHGYTVEYFQRLLIEEVSLKKATDGNFYEFFEKKDKRDRNEPLDVRVYNLAAIKIKLVKFATIAENFAEYAGKNEPDRGKEREYKLNFIED